MKMLLNFYFSFLHSFHVRLHHPSNEAQRKYSELHRKMEAFMQRVEETKKNPDSKYDALIHKQNCVNDTVTAQVHHLQCFFIYLSHNEI